MMNYLAQGGTLLLWFCAQFGCYSAYLASSQRSVLAERRSEFLPELYLQSFTEIPVEIVFLLVAGFLSGELHLPDQYD